MGKRGREVVDAFAETCPKDQTGQFWRKITLPIKCASESKVSEGGREND